MFWPLQIWKDFYGKDPPPSSIIEWEGMPGMPYLKFDPADFSNRLCLAGPASVVKSWHVKPARVLDKHLTAGSLIWTMSWPLVRQTRDQTTEDPWANCAHWSRQAL
jgi:hypothetical protein